MIQSRAQTQSMSGASDTSPFRGLELLSSAVVLLDAERSICYMNLAAEDLLSVSGRAAAGRALKRLAECPATLLAAVANALTHGGNHSGQNVEIRRHDGISLQLNYSLTPVDAAQARLLVEFWPIDQQIKATREERLLEQQLANRELIRNLAHEIKNPLGGIRGAAQLLERELNNPSLREYTQVIIKEADRLQDLMKRLLSSHRPMQPASVNIHEILERVRSLLVAEFPTSLIVRRDYDTSLPELIGDREQLIQAVLNIARNAAQAIITHRSEDREAGQIIFRTRIARKVTLAKRRFSLAIELQVIDNGPGIPEAIRERIFYPLVSGRDEGSGLGLTLAQNFILQHQGTIECQSRPGHTCFTIRIPLGVGTAIGAAAEQNFKPDGKPAPE